MNRFEAIHGDVQQRATRQLVSAVDASLVENVPFPHFVARDVLPADVYGRMVALLPAVSLYDDFNFTKRSNSGLSYRWRFRLSAGSMSDLPPHQRALWLGVRDVLG